MNTSHAQIQRLSTEVVNRIAAGEVVHRPVNALKELLENSLDAGATQITVTVSQGGLKVLQIQDNGSGIARADLAIVCERFTTSKLRRFEDLRAISSFGFRGEALASISHVAHVTITSKTANEPCAYKAHYRDGKLVAKRPGAPSDPTPCAGKNGTQILVEDLFYNLSTRKQALKNASEQYQRILDVVQKYAIQCSGNSTPTGFVCKKHREASCDVNTMQLTTQRDVLRSIYGATLVTELLAFTASRSASDSALQIQFTARGFISNANFSLKKSQFILFINNRLVECPALKRACEFVYALYLPKHTHPFVYLSLELPPHDLDVNVHPTKREVHFLHEEEIVDALSQAIEKQLKGSNESRTFSVQPIRSLLLGVAPIAAATEAMTQTQLLGEEQSRLASDATNDDDRTGERNNVDDSNTTNDNKEDVVEDAVDDEPVDLFASQVPSASQAIEVQLSQKTLSASKKYNPLSAPQRLVRTDHRSNTIDKYFFLESQRSQVDLTQSQSSTSNSQGELEREIALEGECENNDNDAMRSQSQSKKRKRTIAGSIESTVSESRRSSVEPTQRPLLLTSVQNLLAQIELQKSKSLDRMFREHSFVGVVGKQHSLLQFRTKLFVVKHQDVAFHLFYECALRKFGILRPIKLETPLPVYDLALAALANPRVGYDDDDGPREQLADEVKTLLAANGPMLAEYFALDIDAQGLLRTIPQLLADHEPSLHSLPEFIFQLATEVSWEDEESCFQSIAQVLAHWYAELRYPGQSDDRAALVLEHVVFPATKRSGFTPPHALNDASIITPAACLTKLYKIFERC